MNEQPPGIEMLERLADSTGDLVSLMDRQGHHLFASANHAAFLGYETGEASSLRMDNWIHPADVQRVHACICSVADTAGRESIDYRVLARDGRSVWMRANVGATRGVDGSVQVFSIARYVTRQIEMEEELRDSRSKFRQLTEGAGDVLWHMGPDLSFRYMSPAVERHLGYTAEEYMALPPEQQLVEESGGQVRKTFLAEYARAKELASLGQPHSFMLELRHRRKDGSVMWGEVNVAFLYNSAMRITGAHGVTRNIDDRKRVEEALESSERHYRRLFDENRAGLAVCDIVRDSAGCIVDARYVEVNRAYESQTGLPRDAVVGRMASELFSPAEVAHGLQILASVLDGQSFREELAMPTVGRWFDSTTWAMSQDRYVVMIEDISMRRRLEEEVFRTQKLDSVGLLAGGIAHDFNNILTGIVGNISLVRLEAGLDTRAHSMLESAESACGRARDLTQQLLTFSRGGDPVKADASLPDVLRQAADFVMAGSNVSCTYRFAASGLAVAIDRGQISQVVQNLVLNALQAMPDGGSLEIGADRVDLSEGSVLPLRAGTWVRFWVRDHGDGIDAKHLGKIFDPYFTTKKTGVGLGLPVAFSIVRKHGGSITVDSAVGRGSDFTVYLPTSPEPAVSDVDKVPSGIISRRRVLLMDDDSMVREVIGRMLVSLGYEASSVPDGREAVRLFKHHMQQGVPFDVVLMDLTVPGGMGGKAAMKEILALDPSARSIVMSGYCMDSVMANHHAHGFLGVLQKPVRMSDLQSALERVLALPPG